MGFLLWIAAALLVSIGIFQLVTGDILIGLILIVVGFGVGPGGFTFFKRSRAHS